MIEPKSLWATTAAQRGGEKRAWGLKPQDFPWRNQGEPLSKCE